MTTLGDLLHGFYADLVDNAPDFVQRPTVASEMIDPSEQIIARRKVPCICPEQERGACGRTVAYSNISGRLREQVACDRCPRVWTRVNC